MATATAPPPAAARLGHLPTSTASVGTSQGPARPAAPTFTLLYTRPKVYIHPTPYARDNVSGVLVLLRDNAAPISTQALWLAFLPEAVLPPREDAFVHVCPGVPDELELESDYDAGAWREAVHAAFNSFYVSAIRAQAAPLLLRRPAEVALEQSSSTSLHPEPHNLALTPILSPDEYAFAFPLAAAQGLALAPPTFSQWYGSVRVMFKRSPDTLSDAPAIQLPTIFYHDDESLQPLNLDFESASSRTSMRRANTDVNNPPTARSYRFGVHGSGISKQQSGSPSSGSNSHYSSPSSSRTSTPVTQRGTPSVASSPMHRPPSSTWGGDELIGVLRRYTNVFRSLLQPGMVLLNPLPEVMAQHGSPYYESDVIDRPLPPTNPVDRSEVDTYDPGLDDIYRLDPYFLWQSTRTLVLTRFANLTKSARQASQQVLAFSGAPPSPPSPPIDQGAYQSLPSFSEAPKQVTSAESPLASRAPRPASPFPGSSSHARPEVSRTGTSTPLLCTNSSAGPEADAGRVGNRSDTVGSKGTRSRMRNYLNIGLSPLTKPVQTFAQAGPVPLGPLTDAEWGRISQQGGVEFDSARTYLSRWARLVADAGERCRRSEASHDAPPRGESETKASTLPPGTTSNAAAELDPSTIATDEVEEEVGQLGVFELLARCPDVPVLPSTRHMARDQAPVTLDEWQRWFDPSTGRLCRSIRWVKQAIFARGIAPDLPGQRARQAIWPFLLGIVHWDSTQVERDEAWSAKQAEYQRFKLFWESNPTLLARDDVLDQRSLIRKDCLRSDRNHPLFRSESPKSHPATSRVLSASIIQEKEFGHAGSSGNQNTARLGEILLTYGFWEAHQVALQVAEATGTPAPRLDPKTFAYQPAGSGKEQQSLCGYVQGMSDLCSLLYIVCEGDDAATFWCFVHLMQRLAPHFYVDQFAITGQLIRLQRLLALMDPAFHAHLKQADGLNLFFAYRWFLVGFRREFAVDDTLKLWDCMLAAEFTPLSRSFAPTAAHTYSTRPTPPTDVQSPKADGGSRWGLWNRLARTAGIKSSTIDIAEPNSGSTTCASPSSPERIQPRSQLTDQSDSDDDIQPKEGLTSGFSLFVALAMMQYKRDSIMAELFEFDEILAFINGLSKKLDVEQIITSAEKAARAAKVLFRVRDATEDQRSELLEDDPDSNAAAPSDNAINAMPIPQPTTMSQSTSAAQPCPSSSLSRSCSVLVQVPRSSISSGSGFGSAAGSGWSRLGGELHDRQHEARGITELDDPHAFSPCPHHVCSIDEGESVQLHQDFSSAQSNQYANLDLAELEEIRAAHALARSRGATPLCARVAEAEELRQLVLPSPL